MFSNNDLVWFKQFVQKKTISESLKNIKLIITDIDGSLTDSNVYLQENGEDLKGYSTQDGYAISKAIKAGIQIAFLTGKTDKTILKRAQIVGIPKQLCHLGASKNKIENVLQLQKIVNAEKKQTLFFGDDHLDLETKSAVGFFVCPENSPFYVQYAADIIVPKKGGKGSFRLLLDLVLYLQNKHFAQQFIKTSLH